MRGKAFIAAGAAVCLAAGPMSGALAQSAPKPGERTGAGAPSAKNAPTQRSAKPASAGGQAQGPRMSQLTEQECRNLGGAVHTAPQCKKTGTRCVIRLAGGQVNAPCIDEVATK